MNVLHLLSSLPWVERLGWTLVHFIWQGFAIATVYGVARRARSGLAGIALAAMLAAPAVTWSLMSQADRVPNSAQVSRARAVVDSRTRATSIVIAAPSAEPQSVMTWVVALWLAGSVTSWARLAMGLLGTARLRSTLVRPAPPEWQRRLRELGERIQVTRPVRLLASAIAQSPCVVGWIRPVVLVPVGMLAGLPAEQVEALLLHELAHVRRHDYLINILQSVAEALLFYNRAVWWVSGHIRTEREQCCDNIAAAASGDVPTYARALAVLESWRPSHALAATGGSLPDRIARLLAQPRSALSRRSAAGAVVTALLLIVPLCILSGQS
jgi:beta-lactamase regulating signal transducer with metallopeptidase domain